MQFVAGDVEVASSERDTQIMHETGGALAADDCL